MYDYNDYDGEYLEPSLADEIMEEFKNKVFEVLKTDVKNHVETSIKTAQTLHKENLALKQKLSEKEKEVCALTAQIQNSSIGERMFSQLNESNFKQFCATFFKKSFVCKDADSPLWATILVEYYNNKTEIIELMKAVGVKMPENVENFRLPIDWTQEELDTFFKALTNRSFRNFNTYDGVLSYWFNSALGKVADWIKQNYVEVPWELLLRNKLLNTKDNYIKMAQVVSCSKSGDAFLKLREYQEMSDENFQMFIDALCLVELPNTDDKRFKFLECNIEKVTDTKTLDALYAGIVKERYQPLSTIKKMPKAYLIEYFTNTGATVNDVIETAELTQEEKLQILSYKIK